MKISHTCKILLILLLIVKNNTNNVKIYGNKKTKGPKQ